MEYRWLVYALMIVVLVVALILVWRLWEKWPHFTMVDTLPFTNGPQEVSTRDPNSPIQIHEPLYSENWSTELGLLNLQELNGQALLEVKIVAGIIVRCLGAPCNQQSTPEYKPFTLAYAPAGSETNPR